MTKRNKGMRDMNCFILFSTSNHQQTYQNWNQNFHLWENPTPPSWFREVQRILTSIPLSSPIPSRNTEIHRNEESHTPTSLRHRENIGRIGSLRVFWQMSVIAVFPQKTGDPMFVGFDSQNSSHSIFHTIPIGIFGFLGGIFGFLGFLWFGFRDDSEN